MKKTIVLSLALGLSLSSCVLNVEEQAVDKEAVADATDFTSMTFDGGDLADKLVITGDANDSLLAKAHASVWANNDDDAKRIAEGMQLKWSGTTDARLTIEYPGTEREFVRVERLGIELPQRLQLDLALSSSDLDVLNMKGDVKVDISSGDVKVGTEGRVDIESSSGDVDVSTGKGGRIDVSSGETHMDVTKNTFEDVHIESSSGNVTISIADGAGIDFDLETSSGVVAVNYGGFSTIAHEGHVTVSVNGGGRKVFVSSSSGDIQVSKL